jgi:hypothetical protein
MANTACMYNVAKSTAVSCIFPCVALCATQTESSNMMCNWFFHAKILDKRCVYGIWMNMEMLIWPTGRLKERLSLPEVQYRWNGNNLEKNIK